MKADHVMALVKAHAYGDRDRFRQVALMIAADAEGKSPRTAKSIRTLIERMPEVHVLSRMLPQNLEGLLQLSAPTVKVDDVVLDAPTRARIDRVLSEQAARDRLLEHGLTPMRKLLFSGPPGVGKTMMAAALANALEIPLFRVQLHGVISQYLGETAGKLGKVFDNIRSMRGVYLFDEFDALAADRGGDKSFSEVGEMRRVVNSLLQFIELDDSESVIIGATNYRGVIDRAMFRRFHDVIEFQMPTPAVSERLLRAKVLWGDAIDWDAVKASCDGVGHADLVAACEAVNKEAVLSMSWKTTTDELVEAIRVRRAMSESPAKLPANDLGADSQSERDDNQGGRVDRGGARPPVEDARS